MSNESWLGNGDCKVCRRQPYCNKLCKAKEVRAKRLYEDAARREFCIKWYNKKEEVKVE